MDVLISGPGLYGYNESLADGFERLGHTVTVSEWPNIENTWIDRMKMEVQRLTGQFSDDAAVHRYIAEQNSDIRRSYSRQLETEVDTYDPDVLLIVRGNGLVPDVVRSLSDRPELSTVVWCYDRAMRYPTVLDFASDVDQFYTFEPGEIPELEAKGIDAEPLLASYDDGYYHPVDEGDDNPIDVSFVGALYPRRRELLETLVRERPDLNVQVWSPAWTWTNPITAWRYLVQYPSLGDVLHNHAVPHAKINWIYNRSRICFNHHHSQSELGLNNRTFEILGSRSFQLIEDIPGVSSVFTPEEHLVTFEKTDEFLEKIEYYLEHDDERERIAASGHEAVQEYRFVDLAQTILTDVQSL